METKAAKKTNLRKAVKSQLKNMPQELKNKCDHAVFERLIEVEAFQQAKCVYGYMALSWETGTTEILEYLFQKGIPAALPRVMGDDMEYFHVRSFHELHEGAFHILEPDDSCEKVHWPDACLLVPGLAFSLDGKRLGKGGGYYDKLLAREPDHMAIALAYDYQVFEQIPAEEHDRSVNLIVTEKRMIEII